MPADEDSAPSVAADSDMVDRTWTDAQGVRRRARRAVLGIVLLVAVAALVGAVVLWPRGPAPSVGTSPTAHVRATVDHVVRGVCPSIDVPDATERCQEVFATREIGEERQTITFSVGASQLQVPTLHPGDQVVLMHLPNGPPELQYYFVDFQRGRPLLGLVIVFAVVVMAFGRWQGLRALIALSASGLILVLFTVPALIRDSAAVPVALTATVLIALCALYVTHGISQATTVALAGTLFSLCVITAGAVTVSSLAQLTGLAGEEAQTLRIAAGGVDLRTLLIAGMVVGALGVLDDVTVTQVSVVTALRRASPSASTRHIYLEATRVGRDHVASTVNTLVLTYAGAALPLLLLFAAGVQPTGRLLTSELVAVEIIRMLVGSIGLVLSVPVTTALAAVTLAGDDDGGGHQHSHGSMEHVSGPSAAQPVPPSWEDFRPEQPDLPLG